MQIDMTVQVSREEQTHKHVPITVGIAKRVTDRLEHIILCIRGQSASHGELHKTELDFFWLPRHASRSSNSANYIQ